MIALSPPETARVWARRSRKSSSWLELARFHGALTGALLWGAAVNFIIAFTLGGVASSLPLLAVVGAYAALAWGGGRLMLSSKSPLVSFVGVSLAACPLGLTLQRALGAQGEELVMQVVFAMGLFVCAQGLLALALARLERPALVLWSGVAAGVALNALFALSFDTFSLLHWLILLVMQGRAALYWSKATALAKTADNAVDVAGALVVDSVNPLYYAHCAQELWGARAKGRGRGRRG